MGTRGPVPARSDQRRRRNEPQTPTEQVKAPGQVKVPPAERSWPPLVAAWYRSLAESGQARYFEPSDWQSAKVCAGLMERVLASGYSNAQLIAQLRGMMSDLLSTEGARRRAGIEIVRQTSDEPAASNAPNVARLDGRRKRLTDADAS